MYFWTNKISICLKNLFNRGNFKFISISFYQYLMKFKFSFILQKIRKNLLKTKLNIYKANQTAQY